MNPLIEGHYTAQIIEGGKVVREFPREKNLVLTQGFDYLLSGSYANVPSVFRYHAVGDDGTAASAGQTGLVSEVKRTGTLLTGSGNCGDTLGASSISFRYTFTHTAEVGSVTYREHGLSPSASAGSNLSTRAVFSSPISLTAGQQLRVVYDITVTLSPAAPASATIGGTGWPVSPATTVTGDLTLATFEALTGRLSTSGVPSGNAILTAASGTPSVTMCSAITLQAGLGSSATTTDISGSSISYGWSAYTPGSLARSCAPVAAATAVSYSSTSINGFTLDFGGYEAAAYKWDEAQTKDTSHTLMYPTFTVTWAAI